MESGLAEFSPCRKYRYRLFRRWGKGPVVTFVGLNPSTADENQLDPTCRRCVGFAKSWGFNAYLMLNLFAFRSTDPKGMFREPEPIGEMNDEVLRSASGLIIAAWGVHGAHLGRGIEVMKMLKNPHYLALTKDGFPKHPLYLRKTLRPIPYEA